MSDRKEQWAARWTWEHLTLGVHSTQRAEAVHSAIKHFLTSHTLLVDLATKIENYRNTVADRSEGIATRQALKQASFRTGRHPTLEHLNNRISPFALSLMQSQISLCLQYTVSKDSKEISEPINDNTIYTVRHNSHLESQNDLTNETGESNRDESIMKINFDDIHKSDLGLNQTTNTTRRTTITSCTCLYHSCYGLPCRHMLRVYLNEQLNYVPEGVVASIWYLKTNEEKEDQLSRLLTTKTTLVHPTTNESPVLTQNERYTLLCAEFRSLARIGFLSHKHTQIIREEIINLINQLQSQS